MKYDLTVVVSDFGLSLREGWIALPLLADLVPLGVGAAKWVLAAELLSAGTPPLLDADDEPWW